MGARSAVKLRTLKPSIATLKSSLQRGPLMFERRLRGSAGMKRRANWLRLHPFCIDCEAEGRKNALDIEVDHVTPLWKGGADDESNFASRCTDHHKAKTAREAAERLRG